MYKSGLFSCELNELNDLKPVGQMYIYVEKEEDMTLGLRGSLKSHDVIGNTPRGFEPVDKGRLYIIFCCFSRRRFRSIDCTKPHTSARCATKAELTAAAKRNCHEERHETWRHEHTQRQPWPLWEEPGADLDGGGSDNTSNVLWFTTPRRAGTAKQANHRHHSIDNQRLSATSSLTVFGTTQGQTRKPIDDF